MEEEVDLKNKTETEELDDQDLEPVPDFYKSPTANPVSEIVRNNQNIRNVVLRLERFIDTEITIPEATFNFMTFQTDPGIITLNESHKVRKKIPYIYIYVPVVQENIVIPNATTGKMSYTSTILNYNFSPVTITVRAYVYTIIKRI